jgi:hypothetical protein
MSAREISEAEVRGALTFLQNLHEDFPNFAYDDDPSPELLAKIDVENMAIMRQCLEAAAATPIIPEVYVPGDKEESA